MLKSGVNPRYYESVICDCYNVTPLEYKKQFLTLPITDFVEYIKEGQKWKLQSHGMWEEPKSDLKETIEEFKQKGLILTKDKLAKINGR